MPNAYLVKLNSVTRLKSVRTGSLTKWRLYRQTGHRVLQSSFGALSGLEILILSKLILFTSVPFTIHYFFFKCVIITNIEKYLFVFVCHPFLTFLSEASMKSRVSPRHFKTFADCSCHRLNCFFTLLLFYLFSCLFFASLSLLEDCLFINTLTRQS